MEHRRLTLATIYKSEELKTSQCFELNWRQIQLLLGLFLSWDSFQWTHETIIQLCCIYKCVLYCRRKCEIMSLFGHLTENSLTLRRGNHKIKILTYFCVLFCYWSCFHRDNPQCVYKNLKNLGRFYGIKPKIYLQSVIAGLTWIIRGCTNIHVPLTTQRNSVWTIQNSNL